MAEPTENIKALLQEIKELTKAKVELDERNQSLRSRLESLPSDQLILLRDKAKKVKNLDPDILGWIDALATFIEQGTMMML